MTIQTEIAKRQAVCEAATPGPWRVRPREFDDWGLVRADARATPVARALEQCTLQELEDHRTNGTDPTAHNAAFIAHARQGYPQALAALAACVEALEKIAIRTEHARTFNGAAVVEPTHEAKGARAALARVAALLGVNPSEH